MLLVANLPTQNNAKKLKMTETLAYESTQQKLPDEYQHDRI